MESMAAIVRNEKRTRTIVFQYTCAILQGVKPMIRPEIIAATTIPDPVAVSQFNEYTAASGVGLRTTGRTRWIIRCNPATGSLGPDSLPTAVFTVGKPHAKTHPLKTSPAIQATATNAL